MVSMFTAITLSRSLMLAMISNPSFRKPEYYGMKAFGKISSAMLDAEAQAEDESNDRKNDNIKDNKSGAVL
jgi:preprotein translocase subunit SecD